MKKLRKNSGFTLIEMLIVVAIIAILIAISIPLINGVLERARDSTDQANERSAKAEALLIYMGVTKDADKRDNIIAGTNNTDWDASFWAYGDNKGLYYNAATGELLESADTITRYGKCTHTDPDSLGKFISEATTNITRGHEDGILQVIVQQRTDSVHMRWVGNIGKAPNE